MKDILIIVPSRGGRLENYERLIQSWRDTTTGHSDLVWALDSDDHHNYPTKTLEGLFYTINPRMKMIPTLNYVAVRNCTKYKWLAFLGDDHVLRTEGWEDKFMETGPLSICYGDDLLQGPNLPTAVCLTSNIVAELGYMITPGLIHMYADNFWRDLGHMAGILNYFPDVIIEHMHFSAGKSEQDQIYTEVSGYLDGDHKIYLDYATNQLGTDARKIRILKEKLLKTT